MAAAAAALLVLLLLLAALHACLPTQHPWDRT